MFIMAAHGVYFILVPLMALLLTYLRSGPTARSARFSAIPHVCGNTIPAILHQTVDYPDVSRHASFPWDLLCPLLARFRMFSGTE